MAKAARKLKEVDINKPPETREQKLIRLTNRRVEKACKYVSLIGNLVSYRPTSSDTDKIMEALGATCAEVEARLRGVKKESYAFSLRTHTAIH